MTNQPTHLSADMLLQHEPFVRAVVRGLLSNEAGVQDVVQDTWLATLRQPPRSGASLRAWLARVAGNLSRDAARRTSRREVRERAVARSEKAEPVDVTYERLEGQRKVVDAVLALREPYRTVVLLRYYQDLTVARIAERLERSPATVRSQLSRAREILKSRLDASLGRDSAAWSTLLLPLIPWPSESGVLAHLRPLAGTTLAMASAAIVVMAVSLGAFEMAPSGTAEGVQGAALSVSPGFSPSARAELSSVGSGLGARVPVDANQSAVAPDLEASQGAPQIHGRIIGVDGRAVAGATVSQYWSFPDPDSEGKALWPTVTLGGLEFVTDAEGRFRGDIAGRVFPMVLVAMDASRTLGAARVVRASGERVPDISLVPMVTVTGRVDAHTAGEVRPGQVGVWVKLVGEQALSFSCMTDTGAFGFRLPPGDYEFYYSTDILGLYNTIRPAGKTVTVEQGSEEIEVGVIEIELPTLAEAILNVRGPDGALVEGARASEFWMADDGPMRPVGGATTDGRGVATITLELHDPEASRCLLVLDGTRSHGATVVLDPEAFNGPVNVSLLPTTRVHGRLVYAGDGKAIPWSNVYIYKVPGDFRVARCANGKSRFEFQLPPGDYRFNAYGVETHHKDWTVTLTPEELEMDLGVVELEPTPAHDLVGKAAPAWTVTDARGVDRRAKPGDFRGRYILIEFWGYW